MQDSPEVRERLLRNVSIFGGLQSDHVQFLVDRSTLVEVASGDCYFEEGSRGTSAFVIETGRVAIVKQSEGRDRVLGRLGPGDCFGEVALIDFGARSASVRAEEDGSAIEFTARDLLEIARRDSEQFALIYMNLARELSRRLRTADDRLFQVLLSGGTQAQDHIFDTG